MPSAEAGTTIEGLPAQVEVALLGERLRLYHGNIGSAVVGHVLMAALLVAVLWRQVPGAYTLVWLGSLTLGLAARIAVSRTPLPAPSDGVVARAALLRFRLILLGLGLVWGSAGVLLFPASDPTYQTFLAFVLAGMAAGTLTLTAFDLWAALAFSLLALLPLSLRLLGAGGATQPAMAGMVMLFTAFLALVGLRSQRNVRDTVALRTAESMRAETLLRNQTRLQQLSDELTAKTDALALTLDSMAQGILGLGADGHTNVYNQRLLQLLDLPAALMAGRPTMDQIARYQFEHDHYGEQMELVGDDIRTVLRQWNAGEKPSFPPLYFRRTRAGAMLEVKTRYLPDGGLVRTFSDVTLYFDAQQKLRDSEAQANKLALVAAHTDDAVAITDARRRTEWVNQGFTRLTGFLLDEVVGRVPADLLRCPHTDAAEVQRMELQLREQQHTAGELLCQTKDGRPFWMAVETHAIVGDDGQLRQYISIGRDISQRKATDDALRAARDEAQRASQAKSEFLSAMSHELRTPMNAILGFSQLLAADAMHPLPARQQGQVREIVRAGTHLLALINDVLDLARVEAGKQPIVIESVPAGAMLADCLALMRPAAQDRNIGLTQVSLAACDCFLAADRTRLKQVLLNLLSNAVKYNRSGGEVRITCEPDGDAVRISVSDTGPGLTDAQRERLFNAFERLGADDGPIEGAGIGLVLSKRLVELMKGSIGVDSQPGHGSTFWIRLPMAAPPTAPVERGRTATATSPTADGDHGASTVLYIEDNPVNVLLMEAMLEHEPGVRLVTAHDPLLGLTLARSQQPQLILLDIQLPGIDGFEVLRRLRGEAVTRSTPVVAISANAMPSDIQQGLDAGFDAYLTKPLDLEQLRTTVRHALQR